MQVWARYLILVFGITITLHFILQYNGQAASFTIITSHLNFKGQQLADFLKGEEESTKEQEWEEELTTLAALPPATPTPTVDVWLNQTTVASVTPAVQRRANATFVILARNSDLEDAIGSVREIEDRFNRGRNYPYVFLNEEPFTEEFKLRISVLSKSLMEFGVIPHDDWYQPKWIDERKARAYRQKLVNQRIPYAASVSYRNMCRFNSGFFFRHELLQKYRWYWRIEPNVHFHCNIEDDPFLFMEDNDKSYGFTITLYEFPQTITTLWNHVRDFMVKYPEYISDDHAMAYLSNDNGRSYNMCHFWSNFEIADLDFWRGEAYSAFFQYLDTQGGFYYERWGDAPVHSIAAALFLRKDQIHFFEDIGYEHSPHTHCPKNPEVWARKQCSCNPSRNSDYHKDSCLKNWEAILDR